MTSRLEETLTSTESEITSKKINLWTICRELRLFRHLACQTERCALGCLFYVCVSPCIVRIIRNLWPKWCNYLVYLFVPISSTCFGRCFRPSSEALDLFTACDIVHLCCCRPVSWTRFHLVHDTCRQQHRWTISQAVNKSSVPDDGRKHRPKHVELIEYK